MTTTEGKYDLTDVKEALRNIASRSPDAKTGCRYRNTRGEPHCVVGHLLAELGLHDVLAKVQNHAGVTFLAEGEHAYDDDFASAFSEGAVNFMSRVQQEQDEGETWGTALARNDDGFDLNAVR